MKFKVMDKKSDLLLQQSNTQQDIILPFIDWLLKKNLMISESVNGYYFKSSIIGGKKYTNLELYRLYENELVIINQQD